MDEKLLSILLGSQAYAINAMQHAHVQQMDLQQKAFTNKMVSVDLAEAAAAKELAKAGVATDLSGIRAGSNTPPLPTQGS